MATTTTISSMRGRRVWGDGGADEVHNERQHLFLLSCRCLSRISLSLNANAHLAKVPVGREAANSNVCHHLTRSAAVSDE